MGHSATTRASSAPRRFCPVARAAGPQRGESDARRTHQVRRGVHQALLQGFCGLSGHRLHPDVDARRPGQFPSLAPALLLLLLLAVRRRLAGEAVERACKRVELSVGGEHHQRLTCRLQGSGVTGACAEESRQAPARRAERPRRSRLRVPHLPVQQAGDAPPDQLVRVGAPVHLGQRGRRGRPLQPQQLQHVRRRLRAQRANR